MSFFFKDYCSFFAHKLPERLLEMEQKIIITPPEIPADTFEEMKKFFAATSIPRIIEARKELKVAK
jgi:hypothetical protein